MGRSATPMAAFQTTVEGNVKILTISGRLDLQSGADFRETLRFLTEDDESVDLLVDPEGLDYMASAGFRELFLRRRARSVDKGGGWPSVHSEARSSACSSWPV